MAKIRYVDWRPAAATLQLIRTANQIIDEYAAQRYDLTLRQLYYQLVARDVIPNKQTEYKRLGGIISDARRAGMVDWLAIVDRTRNLRGHPHWDDPQSIVSACAGQFRLDKWATQPNRVEVWIEKDALAGVFERACGDLDIPFFSCRGYTSDSELWSAGQRLRGYAKAGQNPIVLHFGDHDPSGMDMTRDIRDRLRMFAKTDIEVRRLALNIDQVQKYNPPPNPAKESDARFAKYDEEFGSESWELDALNPTILGDLVRAEVDTIREPDLWADMEDRESQHRTELQGVADKWPPLIRLLPTIDRRQLLRRCEHHAGEEAEFSAAIVQGSDGEWRCAVCGELTTAEIVAAG